MQCLFQLPNFIQSLTSNLQIKKPSLSKELKTSDIKKKSKNKNSKLKAIADIPSSPLITPVTPLNSALNNQVNRRLIELSIHLYHQTSSGIASSIHPRPFRACMRSLGFNSEQHDVHEFLLTYLDACGSLVGGNLLSTLKCIGCGKISTSRERYSIMSLQIPSYNQVSISFFLLFYFFS